MTVFTYQIIDLSAQPLVGLTQDPCKCRRGVSFEDACTGRPLVLIPSIHHHARHMNYTVPLTLAAQITRLTD